MKINLDDMKDEAVRNLLEKIIDKLDELDEEDFFGTEGWEHFFGLED